VCVTGASGFIASWLVKLLLERDYTVRGTIRSPGTSRDFVSFYSFHQCRCLQKLGEHKIISWFARGSRVWNSKVSWPSVYCLCPPRYRHCDAPRNGAKSLVSLHSNVMWSQSTIETFQASSLKHPLGLHHANHHVFPISYVEYLSSLWMSFKGQSHYAMRRLFSKQDIHEQTSVSLLQGMYDPVFSL
jgi:hypothetical protein